ncbi:MAG: TadE/TadG family type IV pilus assembly protein [Betaproteobacteria bacterium]
MTLRQRLLRGERGAELIEMALVLPLLLLVSVSIFEFGRAYQTWQVLTNAAREGARVAILPDPTTSDAEARVRQYMEAGQLPNADTATITIDRNATISMGAGTASASLVTINYPFEFMVLQPVAKLVVSGTTLGGPITMTATAEMRNESQ